MSVLLACGTVADGEVKIDWVTVGDPGNVGELSGASAGGYGPDRICGAVDYTYNIGKYEVTNSQYREFLNAVAKTDTYGLYKTDMAGPYGGIDRSGSPGSYTYAAKGGDPNWDSRPVNYVSWGDAARFANWLTYGQPTGAQGLATTEDGSYYLGGATTPEALQAVTRKTGALYVIPSGDEWYKAAYHKGAGTNAGYWDYATGSDVVPTAEAPPGTDPVNGSANYYVGGYVDPSYYTTEVGAYDAKPSDSAYGTYDQAGNLWEWNEAIPAEGSRGLRGGSFYNDGGGDGSATLHAAFRPWDGPMEQNAGRGFRVAEVPEPATLSLLVLGGLVLLRRSWLAPVAQQATDTH